jgi:hypothetical protein
MSKIQQYDLRDQPILARIKSTAILLEDPRLVYDPFRRHCSDSNSVITNSPLLIRKKKKTRSKKKKGKNTFVNDRNNDVTNQNRQESKVMSNTTLNVTTSSMKSNCAPNFNTIVNKPQTTSLAPPSLGEDEFPNLNSHKVEWMSGVEVKHNVRDYDELGNEVDDELEEDDDDDDEIQAANGNVVMKIPSAMSDAASTATTTSTSSSSKIPSPPMSGYAAALRRSMIESNTAVTGTSTTLESSNQLFQNDVSYIKSHMVSVMTEHAVVGVTLPSSVWRDGKKSFADALRVTP